MESSEEEFQELSKVNSVGRSRKLIFQVAVGEEANSRLYDSCIASVAAYANDIQAEHLVIREPILRIAPDFERSQRSKESVSRHGGFLPVFEKEYAFDLLRNYDEVLVLDADVKVRIGSPDIFCALPTWADFGAVVERDMPITESYREKIRSYSIAQYLPLTDVDWFWTTGRGAEFFNMGVFVIRKGILPLLKEGSAREWLLQEKFKDFVNGRGPWKWSTDQTLLNYWVRTNDVSIARLDWKWNCLIGAVDKSHIDKSYFRHFFLGGRLAASNEESRS